jgi:uncharacterized protein involved in outer membrane biogenesis
MRRHVLKRILIALGGAVGLLAVVVLAVPLLVDVNRYKPQLEAAASDTLGMDVRIGRLSVGLFPALHLGMEDARILDERGEAVASAKRTSLGIDLLPLLRRELRLRRIQLTQPRLSIERDSTGRVNVERLKKGAELLRALDGASVTLSDGTLSYSDARSGEKVEATHCDLAVSRMRHLGSGKPTHPMKGLSLKAELTCGEIRGKRFSASALHVSIHGQDGVIDLNPATMRLFGARAAGTLRADFSDTLPRYQVHCSLPGFQIEEFLKILSPEKTVVGTMNFSASLSTQGKTRRELLRAAAGEISLRGSDLTILGNDLDRELSRFKSSQHFNLVDVGAVFFAGPMGLAVTKGYNFASLFKGSGGSCSIGTLVSDWRVEGGVARAKDVAMATPQHRIALQGGLDFVNEQFADVTVAVINGDGCAEARQVIRGPFGKPTVDKPHILKSLAGPVLKLMKQTKDLVTPCEVFYSGSVAPPR